jgi:hypothetical protein
MDFVILFGKIVLIEEVLNLLYVSSFNLLFMLGRKPVLWIALVAAIAVANIALAYSFDWDVSIAGIAALLVWLRNFPKRAPSSISEDEFKGTVTEIYVDMGLPHGRMQDRIGSALFALCSLVSFIAVSAEACTLEGECVPIIKALMHA